MADVPQDTSFAKEVVEWGSELSGSGVGAVVGALVAGPAGAVSGAIVGTATSRALRVIGDFAHRHLSARERVKIGAAFGFALERLKQRLECGETPRTDGFFDEGILGRAPADEILEGAVQKCRVQFEERKCRLLAYIYANAAFDTRASAQDAVLMLELVDRLTYRQLCMVALAGRHNEFGVIPFRDFTMQPGQSDPALRWEWSELYNRYWLVTDTDKVPTLTKMGGLLFSLAGLDSLDAGDIQGTWQSLLKGLRHHRDS